MEIDITLSITSNINQNKVLVHTCDEH